MAGQYGGSWLNPFDNIAAIPSKIADPNYNLVPGVGGGASDNVRTASTTTPKLIFDSNKVNPLLDQGKSFEDIARTTGYDLGQIRSYTDGSRPGYGVGPKVLGEKTTAGG